MNDQQVQGMEAAVLEFLDTAYRLERRLDRILSVRGISFSEYRLLRQLAAAEGPGRSRIDLARAVGLTPSAVTRALKPLEKVGYAATVRNERDARQSLATITDTGRELLADSQSALTGFLTELPAAGLGAAEIDDLRSRVETFRGQIG